MIDILKSFASHRSVLLQKKKKKNLPLALHAREKFELDLWASQLQMITGKCADRKGLNSISGAQFTALMTLPLIFRSFGTTSSLSSLCQSVKPAKLILLLTKLVQRDGKILSLFFFRFYWPKRVACLVISNDYFWHNWLKNSKKSKCTLSLLTMKKELPLKLFFVAMIKLRQYARPYKLKKLELSPWKT